MTPLIPKFSTLERHAPDIGGERLISALLIVVFFVVGMIVGQILAGEQAGAAAQSQLDRAIENAQYQVADAISEAHRFRASLICVAETIVDGCLRWEKRVRP